MKKILLIISLFSVFALSACGGSKHDYAGDVKLEASKYEGKSFLKDGIGEVELFRNVDGDTAHFTDGTSEAFSVRFLGVDTPESTGKIEVWGKAASNFTADKLNNAKKIILESNGSSATTDSNGRYLAWVWVDGRLLNLELVQEGYSKYGSVVGSIYGKQLIDADLQAQKLKLKVWSNEEDPDFFYGEAIDVTLKDLRENIEEYNGVKVRFKGIVYKAPNNDGYVQYTEDGETYYGIFIFSQYSSEIGKALTVGHELEITGQVAYYEPSVGSGSYQIVDTKYSTISSLKTKDDIKILSTGNEVVVTDVVLPDVNPTTNPNLERTLVQVNNVIAIADGSYTSSAGHVTVIVQDADGNKLQIYIRADYKVKLGSAYGAELITSHNQLIDYCTDGKSLTIKGIVTQYNGKFQLEITSGGDFTLN